MRKLRKFISLAQEEKYLLVKTAVLLVVVRLGLWLLPFKVLRNILAKIIQKPSGSSKTDLPVERMVWSVRAVSKYVPKATCLTQALAGQVLLAKYGYSTDVRIGVNKDAQGHLKAHAWVACDDRVVIGGTGLERYVPFPSLEG